MAGLPEKQPQILNQPGARLSHEYDNEAIVMEAEQVAISAFSRWVEEAGLHEGRVHDVLNSAEKSPKRLLKGNERSRVIRQAGIYFERSTEE